MTALYKLILLSTFATAFFFATFQSSFAQDGYCSDVIVTSVGANNIGTIVQAQNTRSDCGDWERFAYKWFYVDNSGGNANVMVAAAMTAMAMESTVTVVHKSGNTYTNWGSLMHISANRNSP
ncbi:hypothetical protein [Desulforhopalus sp. 52FAK]